MIRARSPGSFAPLIVLLAPGGNWSGSVGFWSTSSWSYASHLGEREGIAIVLWRAPWVRRPYPRNWTQPGLGALFSRMWQTKHDPATRIGLV